MKMIISFWKTDTEFFTETFYTFVVGTKILREVFFMPQMMIDVSVNSIARIIQSMNNEEIETLYLLLTGEGKELLKRKKDSDSGRVKFLTQEEVFDV